MIDAQRRINEYLTVKYAAALMGVSQSTMRNWDRRGIIKAYRVKTNRYRLYKKDEILEFLKEIKKS